MSSILQKKLEGRFVWLRKRGLQQTKEKEIMISSESRALVSQYASSFRFIRSVAIFEEFSVICSHVRGQYFITRAYFPSLGQSSSTPPPTGTTASTNTTQESTSSTASSGKSCYQAVRADGIPLCLFCKSPVDFVDKLRCSDWDARFCSHDCKREYQVS